MCRLIESIRLFNGVFARLAWHQARVDRASEALFHTKPDWQLHDVLQAQAYPTNGLYKCRVLYDEKLVRIEFSAYQAKPIQTVKLVTVNAIEYSHKYADRTAIEAALALRDGCDDILIVKNGLLTDTSYANIVFGKDGRWFTPESHVLPGTMRQYLLEKGVIETATITVNNFRQYHQYKLINAMLQFDGPALDVSNIL
jgi:4-amino-4-deoxychorismate lyase